MPIAPTFFSRQNQFSIFKNKDEWLERWLDRATAAETDDPTRPDPIRSDPIATDGSDDDDDDDDDDDARAFHVSRTG